MSLYFLYCVRYLVFFVLSYLFGCYHFLMNKDIYCGDGAGDLVAWGTTAP